MCRKITKHQKSGQLVEWNASPAPTTMAATHANNKIESIDCDATANILLLKLMIGAPTPVNFIVEILVVTDVLSFVLHENILHFRFDCVVTCICIVR